MHSTATPPLQAGHVLGRTPTCDEDDGRLVGDWSPLDRAKLVVLT